MAAEPHTDEPQAEQPPPKKSKIDDGYGEWTCGAVDDGDDSGVGLGQAEGEGSLALRVAEELDRYLREAKPTSTENLLHWWDTQVRLVW